MEEEQKQQIQQQENEMNQPKEIDEKEQQLQRKYEEYENIKIIGSGSYSSVYKAQKKGSEMLVAIKELKNGKREEGFSTTSLREIQLLQEINHPNVIKIIEIIFDKKEFIESNASI